jgi:hypothetical protein
VQVRETKNFTIYVERRDVEKEKNPNSMLKEFLVPRLGGKDAILGCLREPGNPAAGCIGEFGFANNFKPVGCIPKEAPG